MLGLGLKVDGASMGLYFVRGGGGGGLNVKTPLKAMGEAGHDGSGDEMKRSGDSCRVCKMAGATVVVALEW